jgi:hypothetical protein
LVGAFLASDSEADEGADYVANLDSIFLGQVAEMLYLDLSVGVL